MAMKSVLLILTTLTLLFLYPVSLAVEKTAKSPSRTPSFTREGSESCLHCHSGDKMRAMAANIHGDPHVRGTPAAAHGCESCHGKGSIHISRAHGGRGFPLLIEFGRGNRGSPRDVKLDACLSCHANEDMGEKQVIFRGSAHDRSSTNCSNCHKLHEETDPMNDLETQNRSCSRCHRKDLGNHPMVDDKGIDFDSQKCSTCHDVHIPRDVTGVAEE